MRVFIYQLTLKIRLSVDRIHQIIMYAEHYPIAITRKHIRAHITYVVVIHLEFKKWLTSLYIAKKMGVIELQYPLTHTKERKLYNL